MINRIQLRETISWIALIIAIILFSVTITYAQTKSVTVNSDNGKVHIQIRKTENGKTVSIDTTFSATDDADFERIIERLGGDGDEHIYIKSGKGKKDKDDVKVMKKKIIIDSDKLSDKEKEKLHENLEESMKEMRKGLEKMEESLHSMHIHIDNDFDGDYKFDFDFPDVDLDKAFSGNAYAYSFHDNRELDSLDDQDHVIVMGDKDEEAPVLEKTITTKNGNKVFVYKRSGKTEVKSNDPSEDLPGIKNLKYYPNPSNGKFTLSFFSESRKDILISISDENGKEVYKEKMEKFEGSYSKEIDLTGKGSGAYYLKITIGTRSTTAKILVE